MTICSLVPARSAGVGRCYAPATPRLRCLVTSPNRIVDIEKVDSKMFVTYQIPG